MHGPKQMFANRKSALSQSTTRLDRSRCENKHPLSWKQSNDLTALITRRMRGLLRVSGTRYPLSKHITHLFTSYTYTQTNRPTGTCVPYPQTKIGKSFLLALAISSELPLLDLSHLLSLY